MKKFKKFMCRSALMFSGMSLGASFNDEFKLWQFCIIMAVSIIALNMAIDNDS